MPGRTVGYRTRLFRALHAEAAKRKIDHDALHEIITMRFGHKTMADCTDRQLLVIYKDWTGKGLRRAAKLPRRGDRSDGKLVFAAPDEIAELEATFADLGWSSEQRETFIRRQLKGRSKILTRGDWAAVLFGARAIRKRGERDGLHESDFAVDGDGMAVRGGGGDAGA